MLVLGAVNSLTKKMDCEKFVERIQLTGAKPTVSATGTKKKEEVVKTGVCVISVRISLRVE